MGTHPIFESDFECLTDCKSKMDCSAVEAVFRSYTSSVCDTLESSGMKPAFEAAVSAQRDVIENAGLDCHFTVCGVTFATRRTINNNGLDCNFSVCGVTFGDDHDQVMTTAVPSDGGSGHSNASMITMSIFFIFAMMIFQKL